MGRYSMYGLPDDRSSSVEDAGDNKGGFCMWCDTLEKQNSNGYGFNMCFSNIIICEACVEKAQHAAEYERLIVDGRWRKGCACFKCKKKEVEGYADVTYNTPGMGDPFVLCEDCINWAAEVLKKGPPPPPPGTQLAIVKLKPVQKKKPQKGDAKKKPPAKASPRDYSLDQIRLF